MKKTYLIGYYVNENNKPIIKVYVNVLFKDNAYKLQKKLKETANFKRVYVKRENPKPLKGCKLLVI